MVPFAIHVPNGRRRGPSSTLQIDAARTSRRARARCCAPLLRCGSAGADAVSLRAIAIGDIGARPGYSDLANFTRSFRKWNGMTALAYRRRGADRARGPHHARQP